MSERVPRYRHTYSDDPIVEDLPQKRTSRKGLVVVALFLFAFSLKGTFAANISLTNGGNAEFGQGVQILASCAGSTPLTITPITTFSNSAGAGSYLLSGLTISNIPTSCYGQQFLINAYADTATAPLALFNTSSTDAVIIDSDGTFFTDGSADLGVKTNSNTSVTITFRTPVAQASRTSKFTVQSSANSGTYWVSADQQIYFDASSTSSYSGSGNTWINTGLAGTSKNATISNATFSRVSTPGHFTFGQNKGISYPKTVGDDFTIAVWFRVNACDGGARPGVGTMAFDSTQGQLVSASIGGSASDWDFATISCYLGFQTGSNTGGEETLWASTAFTPNVWHYGVVTRTKSTGRNDLYLDGVNVGTRISSSLTANQNLGNSTQGIGYDTDWGSTQRYFLGDIAVVQQYSTILTQADVQKNYNALRARYGY